MAELTPDDFKVGTLLKAKRRRIKGMIHPDEFMERFGYMFVVEEAFLYTDVFGDTYQCLKVVLIKDETIHKVRAEWVEEARTPYMPLGDV